MKPRSLNTIDEYLLNFSGELLKQLERMRKAINEAAPDSRECISYQMPAFRQGRILVYFAGWKTHIGFYPTSSGIKHFEEELRGYVHSKGAIQFPIDQLLPIKLIQKIVRFRVEEVSQLTPK